MPSPSAPIVIVETPPLTRGRLAALTMEGEASRNTPAYAGKTNLSVHKLISF